MTILNQSKQNSTRQKSGSKKTQRNFPNHLYSSRNNKEEEKTEFIALVQLAESENAGEASGRDKAVGGIMEPDAEADIDEMAAAAAAQGYGREDLLQQ